MPRSGGTYEKVFTVADELLEQGVRPTQQRVRDRLGSGSISTINKALGDWWGLLGQRLKDQRSVPGMPDPVADTANKLWQQALGYAERSFREQSEVFATQVRKQSEEAEQREQKAQQQAEVLRKHNEHLMQENERLVERRKEYDNRINELEAEVISLSRDNTEQQRELKQQDILLKKRGAEVVSADVSDEMLQLKVDLKVRERNIEQLSSQVMQLQSENEQLRKERYQVEQDCLKKQHGLELVIAQQDVRYEEIQRTLKRYQVTGSHTFPERDS